MVISERSRCLSALGYALFEFCLVLPLLLVLLLGALDVSNMLHSYNAVREGAKTALRCSSTTDGLCISAPGSASERFFDVSIVRSQPRYITELFDYGGTASWLSGPMLLFTADAEVLNEVRYNISGQAPAAAAKLVRYPGTGLIRFLLRTDLLPHIDGSPFRPKFTHANGNTYLPSIKLAIDQVQGETRASSAKLIGASTQTIESPLSRVPAEERSKHCFLPQSNQASSPDFSLTCQSESAWPWQDGQAITAGLTFNRPTIEEELGQYTYIVLHITGKVDARQTEPGAVGKVSVALKQNGKTRDLGARTFDQQSDGDFVVRGAPVNYYSASMGKYQEYELHQAIKVQYAVPFNLEFKLQSLNGRRVAWSGGRIEIYTPEYTTGQFQADCKSAIYKSEKLLPEICQLSLANQGSPIDARITSDIPPTLNEDMPEYVGPELYLGCANDERDALGKLSEAISKTAGSHPLIDYELSSAGDSVCQVAEHEISNSCPGAGKSLPDGEPNYGVFESTEPDGFIHVSKSAQKICPADAGYMSNNQNIVISNLHWSTTTTTMTTPAQLGWAQRDCMQEIPNAAELPAEWQAYHKLRLGKPISLGQKTAVTIPSTIDPSLALSNPLFSCGKFSLEEKNVSALNINLPPSSDGLASCNWQDAVRATAISSGIPSQATFKLTRSANGRTADLTSRPSNPCTNYRVVPDAFQSLEPVGRYNENAIPSYCNSGEKVCRLNLVSSENIPNTPQINFERAANEGLQAVEAAIPAAKRNCNDIYCAELKLSVRGDDVISTGKIVTPLYILGGHPVDISYTESKMLEQRILNRRF